MNSKSKHHEEFRNKKIPGGRGIQKLSIVNPSFNGIQNVSLLGIQKSSIVVKLSIVNPTVSKTYLYLVYTKIK